MDKKGLIIKGIGGFYYVLTDEGTVETRGRGLFKKQGVTLCVGDEVVIDLFDAREMKGVIKELLPRRNHFIRPPVANVELMVVVFAPKSPAPNYPVIDKFIVTAERKGIEPVICVNKSDLISEAEQKRVLSVYDGIYRTLAVSSKTGSGLDELAKVVRGKRTALAGPSGVGKSSLLNALHPQADMDTGAVSKKTGRGRHTTRHVEIFTMEGGGMLFDTPGFTSFELADMEPRELADCYREFADCKGKCRYDDCRHLSEPGCAVREALACGLIHPMRYASYKANVEELEKRRRY